MSKTIMITGGTGYIGSWIAKYLLEAGNTLRLCVRDESKTEKYDFLLEIAKENNANLEIHEADLLKLGSYDEIAKGCDEIFHIASPFSLKIKDAQKQLIDPALIGTKNVLESASKSGTVKRVILTSSVAAVHGDNKDMKDQGLSEFNESHWNKTSNIKHQPYSYSKVLAEGEAWKINEIQNNWDLVVINPSFVMGPTLSKGSLSGSIDFMEDIIKGKFAMGAPKLMFGFVDVRDVAKAHILASNNANAKGRYILAERCMSVMDMTKIIEARFPGKFKLPKMISPKLLMYVVGPMFGITAKFVSNNIGYPIKLNTTKSTKDLGLKYSSMENAIEEMIVQMTE